MARDPAAIITNCNRFNPSIEPYLPMLLFMYTFQAAGKFKCGSRPWPCRRLRMSRNQTRKRMSGAVK